MSGPYWTETRSGYPMVRLTVMLPEGKKRTVWAGKLRPTKRGLLQWIVLTRDGEEEREGRKGEADAVREIIVGSPENVISERPARLNLHYGEMELVPENPLETLTPTQRERLERVARAGSDGLPVRSYHLGRYTSLKIRGLVRVEDVGDVGRNMGGILVRPRRVWITEAGRQALAGEENPFTSRDSVALGVASVLLVGFGVYLTKLAVS